MLGFDAFSADAISAIPATPPVLSLAASYSVNPVPVYNRTTFGSDPPYMSRTAQLVYIGNFAGAPVIVLAGARVQITFDLIRDVAITQRLFDVHLALDEDNGVDAAPSTRIYAGPTINRLKIVTDLYGLAVGGLYVLTYQVRIGPPTAWRWYKVPFNTTPAEDC